MVLRTSTEQKSTEINPMIKEAVLFLQHELKRNLVKTSLQLGPGLPTVFGDRVQLQQVIVNLAVNAIQAMAAVGGAVRGAWDQDRHHVRTWCSDRGGGYGPRHCA